LGYQTANTPAPDQAERATLQLGAYPSLPLAVLEPLITKRHAADEGKHE
jgi:hypothetical protein